MGSQQTGKGCCLPDTYAPMASIVKCNDLINLAKHFLLTHTHAAPAAAVKASSDAAAREQLEKVVEVLVTERCSSFEDCVAWARRKFQVFQQI